MKKNLLIILACSFAVVGCRKENASHAHPHGEEGHAPAKADSHYHNQPPPHGGTMVEVGGHQFSLELVQDSEAGKLQAYVLDAHMEYVPVPENSFSVVAHVNGKDEYLTFERVAEGGGAVPEKSSLFEAKADWIKSAKRFEGAIPTITLGGKTFSNILFLFPKSPANDL